MGSYECARSLRENFLKNLGQVFFDLFSNETDIQTMIRDTNDRIADQISFCPTFVQNLMGA